MLRKLKRIGFEEKLGKGSHPDGRSHSIGKEKGTYHKILKDIGLTEGEYRKL